MIHNEEKIPQEAVVSDEILHLLLQNQGNAHEIIFVRTEHSSSANIVYSLIVEVLESSLVEQIEGTIIRNGEKNVLV